MENILKYWQLCEVVKFQKIKIDKELLHFENLNKQREVTTDHSFKKVYHSLIKVKDLIKIIYEKYNIVEITLKN